MNNNLLQGYSVCLRLFDSSIEINPETGGRVPLAQVPPTKLLRDN